MSHRTRLSTNSIHRSSSSQRQAERSSAPVSSSETPIPPVGTSIPRFRTRPRSPRPLRPLGRKRHAVRPKSGPPPSPPEDISDFSDAEDVPMPSPNSSPPPGPAREQPGPSVSPPRPSAPPAATAGNFASNPQASSRFPPERDWRADAVLGLTQSGPDSIIFRASRGNFDDPQQLLLWNRDHLGQIIIGLIGHFNHPTDAHVLWEMHRLVHEGRFDPDKIDQPSPWTVGTPGPPSAVMERQTSYWDALPLYVQSLFQSPATLSHLGIKSPVLTARSFCPLLRVVGGDFAAVRAWTMGSFNLKDDSLRRVMEQVLTPPIKRLPFWCIPSSLAHCVTFDFMAHLHSWDNSLSFIGAHLQLFHAPASPGNVDKILSFQALAQALQNWASFYDSLHNLRRAVAPVYRFRELIAPWLRRLQDTVSPIMWYNRLNVSAVLHTLSDRIVSISILFKEDFDMDSWDTDHFFVAVESIFCEGLSDDFTMLSRLSLATVVEPQFEWIRPVRRPVVTQNPVVPLNPKYPRADAAPPANPPSSKPARTPRQPPAGGLGICLMDLGKRWLNHGPGCQFETKQRRPCPREHLAAVPSTDASLPADVTARVRQGLTSFPATHKLRLALEARLG